MRVALVCPYDWARPGGVQRHVAGLARQLAKDHQLCVVAPSSRRDPEPLVRVTGRPVPVRFNRSVAPVALSPLAAGRVMAALRRFRPDVVHVHEPFVPVVSAVATAMAPRPVVATFHAWSDRSRAYRLASPVARRLAARLDARIAVSPAAQAYAGGALGLPLGSFTVVPNGIDPEPFAAAEPLPELVDRQRPLLLFLGRLEPRKGAGFAVRAFLRLRAEGHDVRLCVVGAGPERRRCEQLIPAALRPDVMFAGEAGETDKHRYFASADVFVAPNTGGESFGIVLLEAMAAGLPVVASDIPGFRAVVRDGRQGRLCPVGDPTALAEAVAGLVTNRKLARAMADEGRRTAASYAWTAVAARVVTVYRGVVRP